MNKKSSKEQPVSKIVWLFVGGMIATGITFSFEYIVKPYMSLKSNIRFSAMNDSDGAAKFKLINIGEAPATDVRITIWARGDEVGEGVDILNIQHVGGASDAICTTGLYRTSLLPPSDESTNPVTGSLYIKSQAVIIECPKIMPREAWNGQVGYQKMVEDNDIINSGKITTLLAYIKDSNKQTSIYAKLSDGIKVHRFKY
ncbi:MAG: hypothetical protein ACKE51_01665 [Methylococcaceae bacterium]